MYAHEDEVLLYEDAWPWTQIHPFYGWFILYILTKANLHSSAVFWSILWGSIFPDLPHHLFLFYHIFICDNVYLTNFGCNHAVMSNASNWSHSLPLSLIITLISYLMYCRNCNKSIRGIFCPCASTKSLSQSLISPKLIASKPKIMHPFHLEPVREKLIVDELQKNDKQKQIQTSEATKLLDSKSVTEITNSPNFQILSVKTYSSINSIGRRSRRYSSYSYTHGGWLTCKNCWCDSQGFWRMMTYFFASVFIHALMDFFMHHEVAKREFLPFSWWIWKSPISYYEEAYYGYIAGPIVSAITVILSVWIFNFKKIDWMLSKCAYYGWILVLIAVDIWCCYEIIFLILNKPMTTVTHMM